MVQPTLGQVGFSSLAMLGWAGAALIPIILHLLKRRRQKSVPWAAMQMLKKVIEQESSRAHFKQLLLVALRVGILLGLAVALARPHWSRSQRVNEYVATRPNKLLIAIVDTSYSMGYRGGELTRLERAKQRIATFVRESQPGDAFSLVVMDQPSRAVIGNPTFDSQALLAEAARLSDTARGGDLSSALTIAADIAAEATSTNFAGDVPMPKVVEILILSDLGRDSWQTAVDGRAEKIIDRLGQRFTVTLESVTETKPINVAIQSVQPSTHRATVGHPIRVDVTIASFGSAATNLPVQLELNGQTVASSLIDVEADGHHTLQLSATPEQAGTSVLSVLTPADNLPIDNRVDLVVEVQQGYRILVVDSTPAGAESASNLTRGGRKERGMNPWQLALQPPETGGSNATVAEIRVVSEMAWLTTPMQEWDVIIVQDPTWPTSSQIDRLIAFVEDGGSAIIALGKNHQAHKSLEKLLGLRFLGPSEASDWMIDPLDFQSPVVKPFEGFPKAGLLTTPIFRYWRAEPTDSELKTELMIDLAVNSGDPLIVRRRLGRGMVAGFLSSPEDGRELAGRESWNAIVAWPSFLPLAQQLVLCVLDVDAKQSNRLAGQSLSGAMPRLPSIDSIILQRPDHAEVQLVRDPIDQSGRSTWTYSATDLRGLYRVTSSPETEQIFAVNIDPGQSSLESIDPNAIRALRNGPRRVEVETGGSSKPHPSDRLSRVLLSALGLLLISESLVAWMLGRRVE